MKHKWLMILTAIMALAIAAYFYLRKKAGAYLVTNAGNIIVYGYPDAIEENIFYSAIPKDVVLGKQTGETADFYEFQFEHAPYDAYHYVKKSDVDTIASIDNLKDDLTIFTA